MRTNYSIENPLYSNTMYSKVKHIYSWIFFSQQIALNISRSISLWEIYHKMFVFKLLRFSKWMKYACCDTYIKMHAFAEIWPFGWFMLRGTKQENAVLAKCHPLGFGTVISRILTLIFSPFLDNISWIVRDVP